jgi:hypothetical protein
MIELEHEPLTPRSGGLEVNESAPLVHADHMPKCT